MATVTQNLAAAQSMTLTFNPGGTGLAAGVWRESTAVDNSSSKYVDAIVGGIAAIGAVGATAGQALEFYAYGSYDGTKYTAGLTGTDSSITWGSGATGVNGYMDLVPLGVANVEGTDDNDDVEFGPFSVAAAFGGVLPTKWGIVVKNATDAALNNTQTNAVVKYMGVKYDVA